MNSEQPIIVGLDIGTTKIAAIAGRKNEFGKLEILGFGRANSNGVQHGMVLNIDQTIKAIQTALENCYASNPTLPISEVYVGIAGHHIKSLQTRGDIVRQNTDEEIILKDNLLTSFLHYSNDIAQNNLQRLAINSFGNVREKVAFHLCHLSSKLNLSTIHLSREDLAGYCGIAKETLIRTLTEFKDEKLIRLDQDGIAILQQQKLIPV